MNRADHALLLGRMLTGRLAPHECSAFSAAQWQDVADLACREGLAPALYWTLNLSERLSLAPASAQAALRLAYGQSWVQNQRLLAEMGKITPLFAAANIPVVALKGACFALSLYPAPGLRPLGDLDLLVPASRHAEAVALARQCGYAEVAPEAAPGLQGLLAHDVHLRKEDLILEIHHSLVADHSFEYAVPVDWFWTQTEALEAGYGPLSMLRPEAQLLYAAAHAVLQHGETEAPLRWFYDIHLLVEKYSTRLDWDALLGQAQSFGWMTALAVACFRAEALFSTPIPVAVRPLLLAAAGPAHNVDAARDTHTLRELRKFHSLRGARVRFLFLWGLAFPAPAYLLWSRGLNSPWQLPGAYLRRWAGIAADGLRTLRRLVFG